MTGLHNYVLRTMLRGDESATAARLHTELALLRDALAPRATDGSGWPAIKETGRSPS